MPSQELFEATNLSASLNVASFIQMLQDTPVMDTQYSWPEKILTALGVYFKWHDSMDDEEKAQDPWVSACALMSSKKYEN